MTVPLSRKKVRVAVTGVADVLASRKYVSKSPPVKPSAKRHVDESAGTAVASWPPRNPPQYIARSTNTGCDAVTTVAKFALANCGRVLTGIVNRLFAGSV